MPKYTDEELLALRESGKSPQGVDLKAFSEMIADVKEKLEKKFDNEIAPPADGKFTFRRRSSRHETRPHFKKNFRKHEAPVQPDADGWVTLKNTRKSFGASTGAEEARDEFREAAKAQGAKAAVVKVKPNTKNIASRAPADTREAVAEKQTLHFNAFSALGSDEEDDEDDEDDE